MQDAHRRYIAEQAGIFKALGHPGRLLILDALRQGEHNVRQLQELVGDDISTVSRQLAILRETGLVTAEKRGVHVYYSLALTNCGTLLHCAAQIVEQRILERMKILSEG